MINTNGPSNSYYNIRKNINPRKHYINTFLNHQSLKHCPECGAEIQYSSEDEDEAYCTKCGLVTSASIRYVAGKKIDLPYGIRL